jgi:hypothetical protein
MASQQETEQRTDVYVLRMRLLTELQQQHPPTAHVMDAINEAAHKMLAAAKRIASADDQRGISTAQHQQILKEAAEPKRVSSKDTPYNDKPYYAALGHLLVSGRGASGRWGNGRVLERALETILEAHCALIATVYIIQSTCNTYVIYDQHVSYIYALDA